MPMREITATRSRAVRGMTLMLACLLASCSNDGRSMAPPDAPPNTRMATPVVGTALPAEPSPTTAPATVPVPTTSASALPVATTQSVVTIDALISPENATVEVTGAGANYSDPITVDGLPADVISFNVADDTFVARLWVEEEGAHTVCVGGACGRVYTLEPNAQTPEEVIALIEEAMPLARQIVDYPTLFPAWSVEIGGLLSGTGGSTDAEQQIVTIYRNRNRTVDDFVRTIVHEMGHVADAEWLDDDDRAAYLAIRGIAPDVPWRAEGQEVSVSTSGNFNPVKTLRR